MTQYRDYQLVQITTDFGNLRFLKKSRNHLYIYIYIYIYLANTKLLKLKIYPTNHYQTAHGVYNDNKDGFCFIITLIKFCCNFIKKNIVSSTFGLTWIAIVKPVAIIVRQEESGSRKSNKSEHI